MAAPTLAEVLTAKLSSHDTDRPFSLADVLEAVHAAKFTGPLVLHCADGVPQKVEAGRPISIELQRKR